MGERLTLLLFSLAAVSSTLSNPVYCQMWADGMMWVKEVGVCAYVYVHACADVWVCMCVKATLNLGNFHSKCWLAFFSKATSLEWKAQIWVVPLLAWSSCVPIIVIQLPSSFTGISESSETCTSCSPVNCRYSSMHSGLTWCTEGSTQEA